VWGGISTFNGVPLVLKTLNSLDGSFEPTDPNSLSAGSDSHANKNQPDVIDPLSYRVPCPRTSGGIFSTLGYIACFGGSRLFLTSLQQSQCDVASSQSVHRPSDHLEMKTQSLDSNLPSGSSFAAHYTTQSFARSMDSVEPSDIYGRSQSPPPHLAPTPAPLPLVSSSVLYPKTYGDLLVYQRDVKLKKLADVAVAAAAAVVTQQQNRKINEQADNSGQPQLNDETDKMKESQLTIKTTERYYPHFFANGRRGVPTSPLFL
jgi:hypothetical protein